MTGTAAPLDAPHHHGLAQLAAVVAAGDISSEELCATFARRIEALDPTLGAFRVTTLEQALQQARERDREQARGRRRGPLHGLPFAAKDLFDVEGLPTTAGCRVLENTRAAAHCHVVQRLLDAGMVLLGKTNTVQFAYGGAGVNTHHGTPHNPWDSTHRLPGGSSSGSGVAVAAGLAPVALGTDTGGSVRIPASLNGISGLKTTVGRISRQGVYPLSWSLDSVGPLARSVEDCALVFDAVNGAHDGDASTHGRDAVAIAAGLGPGAAAGAMRGLRVGIARSVFFDGADADVIRGVETAAQVFRDLDAEVRDLPFPQAQEALELNPRGLVIAAEAYCINRELVESRFDELDPVVAHRIIKGREVHTQEYVAGVFAWNGLRERTRAALANIDILLCPATMMTAREVAPLLDDMDAYSVANLNYLRNTAIGNILNLCGLSVPMGLDGDGLPMGLMLYAKPFDEATLVRAGHAFQGATAHHQRVPDLAWAGG
jgi:aspartyl-tRNA(Asn)/glutamyl-tRNA(Gln) amidotransferase subunit A